MQQPTTHPRVEMVSLSALAPNPRNARTHNEKQTHLIAASIERFGFVVPIVTDGVGNIVAGHGRYEAARLLGLSEVPTIRKDFVTEADRRAFALADNRIAELSGWNEQLLAEELEFLMDDGYSLDITGFTLADLDLSIGEPIPKDEVESFELPDPTEVAVSRRGDLWLVGPHRIYCEDSCKAESFETLLGGDRPTMVVADPPYNVPIDGHVSGKGKVHHREFAMASGEMSPAEFTAFLRKVFRLCVLFSISGSIHYHFMDWRHIREILDAADGVYAEFKQLLVWAKRNAGQGSFYRSRQELVFVFKNGTDPHINNFGLGKFRYRTNVLDYAGVNGFCRGRERDLEAHPTVKPTALIADLMLDCSRRGDLILDPFCGSGASLLAAHRTGRRAAAIEIDPVYVDAALARLATFTGFDIVHAEGGNFDEIAAQRRAEREANRD